MRLVTIQWKGILDILREKGVYRAQYGYGYRDYIAQYQKLAELCEFSSCPIFCAPIDDDTPLYGINEDEDHIRIELEIPKSRVKEMDYYDWVTYLTYSSGIEAYDEEFNFTPEEALVNLDKYIKLGESRTAQYCIEEIRLEDIVNDDILV